MASDFTAEDLTLVNGAIMDLASGKRVTSFKTANGKTLTYSDTSIDKLREIRDMIRSEVVSNSTKRASRTRLTRTSKGL